MDRQAVALRMTRSDLSAGSRLTGGCNLLHGLYFKDHKLVGARSGADNACIFGSRSRLAAEFHFVTDLRSELPSCSGQEMKRPVALDKFVLTSGKFDAPLHRGQVRSFLVLLRRWTRRSRLQANGRD